MPGPFYLALVEANETTFDPSHVREDFEVYGFELSHEEGDFANLQIEILNPRLGFLADGQPRWAWFSWDRNEQDPNNVDPSIEPNVVPLFFGRIVANPEDLQNETITVSFIARPSDFDDQKRALAEAMKYRPYWDPLLFNPDNRDDPDNVLESRPQLWHIDRITHEVSASHILVGEDGLLEIGEDLVFYDSMHISYGDAPLRRVDVVCSVSWAQQAQGSVDFSELMSWGRLRGIYTFTPHGIVDNWPKPGANIGGGWTIGTSYVRPVFGMGPYVWGYNGFGLNGIPNDALAEVIVPEWADVQTILNTAFPAHVLTVSMAYLVPVLTMNYNVTRNYGETLMFSLRADVQETVTEAGDEETLLLTFGSSELTSPIDPPQDASSDYSMPIGDLRRSTFFPTDRGAELIEYLLLVSSARLLARARTVNIEFEIPFEEGVDLALSCRKSVFLVDYRLPGGSAAGKIISYKFIMDGDSGARTCQITIGCSIGKGNTVEAVDGEGTYGPDDWDEDYQYRDGELIMPVPGEILYASINGLKANDDGFDFVNGIALANVALPSQHTGEDQAQRAAAGQRAPDPSTVFARINAVPTVLNLSAKALTGGPFQTDFDLLVSDLMIPKTFDLEAAQVS